MDSATSEGMLRINQVHLAPDAVHRNNEICTRLCPTWIQTCLFAFDSEPPSDAERNAYLNFLADLMHRDVPVQGVLLYGLARPSMQAQAPRLSALPGEELDAMADRIKALGLTVKVSR